MVVSIPSTGTSSPNAARPAGVPSTGCAERAPVGQGGRIDVRRRRPRPTATPPHPRRRPGRRPSRSRRSVRPRPTRRAPRRTGPACRAAFRPRRRCPRTTSASTTWPDELAIPAALAPRASVRRSISERNSRNSNRRLTSPILGARTAASKSTSIGASLEHHHPGFSRTRSSCSASDARSLGVCASRCSKIPSIPP